MSDPTPEEPARQPFANFQYEIYGIGLSGETPRLPVSVDALQELCPRAADPRGLRLCRRWGRSRADDGGQPAGLRALADRPADAQGRLGQGPDDDDPGDRLEAPLLLAPVGVQSIVHPDAELAVARAAASQGIASILSTAASSTIEDVARRPVTRPAGISSTGRGSATWRPASSPGRGRRATKRSS